jgi:hypothetical protein
LPSTALVAVGVSARYGQQLSAAEVLAHPLIREVAATLSFE